MIRWRYVFHILGALLICIGLCLLAPLGFSLYYRDPDLGAILGSLVITVAVGLALYWACRLPRTPGVISHREGMAITSLGWLAAGLFGSLPYYLSGLCPQLVDCLFETVSGFTTTGASILTDVETVPHGLLFWRSLTHWLGGLGIVVLGLAILPFLGVGGMQLYKAEVPGPVVDKLKPRLRDTAMILWKVYAFFTVLETALLMLGGMSLFDALCHTFGTIATGGFSTKNASIAFYQSAYIDLVITAFMILGGINFALHFQFFQGRPLAMWRDPEWRFFMALILLFTVIIAFSTYGVNYHSFPQALRYAVFQVASILTTTGYATADYELWPALPQAILVLCMFIGGSVGSTSGSVKCMRLMVLLKHSYGELIRLIHLGPSDASASATNPCHQKS